MTIRVAIYDEALYYAGKMMNFLNRNYSGKIEASAFTDREKLKAALASEDFDCVVCADAEDLGPVPVIRISDQPGEGGFYRFQSANELAGQIFDRFRETEDEGMEGFGNYIAVYSPSNGRIRTDFAWDIAVKEQAIYLGMEEYCSQETSDYAMEEIFFLIKEREGQIARRLLASCKQKDGVSYLPSARSYLDCRYLKYEDYAWFIDKLKEADVGRMIFDVGIGNFTDFRIFDLFDQIYLLTEEGEKEKNRLFLKLLEQEIPDVRERLIFVKGQEIA